MKQIKTIVLLLLVVWSFQVEAQEVRLEVVEAEPTVWGEGERSYRSFKLKVLIHNELSDTVHLLDTGYKIWYPNSYKMKPQFWSVAGRVDTTDRRLITDVGPTMPPPPPSPPPAGYAGPFDYFIDRYISVPPKDTLSMEIHTTAGKRLFFPLKDTVYVRVAYRTTEWAFKEENWQKYLARVEANKYEIEQSRGKEQLELHLEAVEERYKKMQEMRGKIYRKDLVTEWFEIE